MKKNKLLIVSIHIKESPQAMPLAAAILKSQLDSVPEIVEKLDVSYRDFYLFDSENLIAEDIIKEKPDLIGFSTYLWNRQLIEKICVLIKQKYPRAILFAGGAEATALPIKLLNSAPFDFVIKGEGELVLTEVMKNILLERPYDNIAGLYSKNQITNNKDNQNPVLDLNSVPSPYLTGAIDTKKYSGVLWELSRGCPFKCSFCFESRNVAGVREISLERLQKELELFELNKVTQVFVLDPTFNRNVSRVKTILKMILKTAPTIHFIFEVRTEFIDREMAKLFSMLNCSLQIGLQSAIPDVLSNVNRKLDPEKYSHKISLLNSTGVVFGLDLIYGLPSDSIAGFRESLNYAIRLQPNNLDIFPLAVLPGTELYEKAELLNLNHLVEAPYTLISSPEFSEQDMAIAESIKNGCDIFYNQGGAAGWLFMILETLDVNPSEFLEDFSLFLQSENIIDIHKNRITDIQNLFVKEQFIKYNKSELFPVMEDIINFNGGLNSSLYAGSVKTENDTRFSNSTIFEIAPATQFVNLKYNFDDLMTVGEYTLEEFLSYSVPEKTFLIIYNCCGEVKPLSIENNYFKLLQTFDGKLSLEKVLELNSISNNEEVENFLEYVINETIININ